MTGFIPSRKGITTRKAPGSLPVSARKTTRHKKQKKTKVNHFMVVLVVLGVNGMEPHQLVAEDVSIVPCGTEQGNFFSPLLRRWVFLTLLPTSNRVQGPLVLVEH